MRALILFGLITVTVTTIWLVASILAHSTRAQFIDQAQLALGAIALLVTVFALIAASHAIWRAATPPRLEALARYEASEAVTTAARGSAIRATVPSGHLDVSLNNRGPGESVLHDVTLKWWIDLVRQSETIVVAFKQPLLLLRYVPDLDFGGESVVHWESGDDENVLRVDRSILIDEERSRSLPRLRLECPDPGSYFGIADGEEVVLRIQVECRSLRREYLWEFTFPVPQVHAY